MPLIYGLSIFSSVSMSATIAFNLYVVLASSGMSIALNVGLSVTDAAFSVFSLWFYFIFKLKSGKSNDEEKKIEGNFLNLAHGVLGLATYGYGAGNGFLFLNTVQVFSVVFGFNAFSFNPQVNGLVENISLLFSVFFLALPTMHVLGKTYYELSVKGFRLPEKSCGSLFERGSCKYFFKIEQVGLAAMRALVLAVSIVIFTVKLLGESRLSVALLVSAFPAVLAFLSNFLGRLALYLAPKSASPTGGSSSSESLLPQVS